MKTNLKNHVYHHIRAKLFSFELLPGAAISHRQLAKELDVSFTPVREAIGQLTNEGLLECHPNRGTYVSKLSRQDLEELYDLRESLECHAAKRIAGKLSEADLTEMERLNDEMATVAEAVRQAGSPHWDIELADRWVVADAAFHMNLLRAAGNRRALKIAGELRMMTQIFGQRKQERSQDDLDVIGDHHRAVANALRKGNAEEASRVLAEHIHRGCRIALAAYDRNRIEKSAGDNLSMTCPMELREKIHEMEQNSEKRK